MANMGDPKAKVAVKLPSQTPFSRHLYRVTASMIHGENRRHWYQWNPGLVLTKPTATSAGAIEYKGSRIVDLQPFASLQDRFGKTEIAIIGSGPSVGELDIQKMFDQTCFLLNGAAFLLEKHVAVPAAFLVEDERFIWSHFDRVKKLVSKETACLFSPAVMRAICEISDQWLEGRSVYLIDSLHKPYLKDRKNTESLRGIDDVTIGESADVGFSSAPWKGTFPAGTVAYTALQFAFALQPKLIGLAGIDLRVDPGKPRFYENSRISAWSGLNAGRDEILKNFQLGMAIISRRGIALEHYSNFSALNEIGIPYSGRFEPIAKMSD